MRLVNLIIIAVFTALTSLTVVADELTDLKQEYASIKSSEGLMSEAANDVRIQISDIYWQDKKFISSLPFNRDIYLYYTEQGISGKKLGRARFRYGKCLRVNGDFEAALPLLKKTYDKRLNKFGDDHVKTMVAAIEVGTALSALGDHTKAIPILEQAAIAREQRFGDYHPKFAFAQMQLGSAYIRANQRKKARQALRTAYQIFDQKKGSRHRLTNITRLKLAKHLRRAGKLDKAERILRKAFTDFVSNAENKGHPLTLAIMTVLGQIYRDQGRYAQAEELLVKSIGLKESVFGKASVKTVQPMTGLVQLYLQQGKVDKARTVSDDLMTRVQDTFRDDSTIVNRVRVVAAEVALQQSRYKDSEELFNLVVDYLNRNPDQKRFRRPVNTGLGLIHLKTGNPVAAEIYFRKAVQQIIRGRGEFHPLVAQQYSYLGDALAKQSKFDEAVEVYRNVMKVSSGFLASRKTFSKAGREQQEKTQQQYLLSFMNLMVDALKENKKVGADPVTESFTIAENTRSKALQNAMLDMTARAAARNDYLSELVRRDQDTRVQLSDVEDGLFNQIKKAGRANKKKGKRLEQKRKRLVRELKKISEEMSYQYPEYARLMNPPPTQLEEVKKLLSADELMLSYYVQQDRTLLWVVNKQSSQLHIIPLGAEQVAKQVQQIRSSLDVPVRELSDIPDYDTKLAHKLYQSLIAPAAKQLKVAKSLIIVPHSALFSLPFGALLSESHKLKKQKSLPFEEYKKAPWLSRKYAISIMPSATALVTMRQYAKHEPAEEPFVGFGDPLFSDYEDTETSELSTRGIPVVQRSAINTRQLKSLPRLPETRAELNNIADSLGAGQDSLYLGSKASESNLRSVSLKDYRVVAFATHGLVAGDLDGLTQPALALTPPEQSQKQSLDLFSNSSEEGNDGLLQMGEVLSLELNADWVVLSACNTASGDSLTGEGFTGLATAFFYAGSRALLVSQWPVESNSTQRLTTAIFSTDNASLSRASALQKARLSLIDGPGFVSDGKSLFSYAHPIFWAAFMIVGEGGKK